MSLRRAKTKTSLGIQKKVSENYNKKERLYLPTLCVLTLWSKKEMYRNLNFQNFVSQNA